MKKIRLNILFFLLYFSSLFIFSQTPSIVTQTRFNKAVLAYLKNDLINAKKYLDTCGKEDSNFGRSRKFISLSKLINPTDPLPPPDTTKIKKRDTVKVKKPINADFSISKGGENRLTWNPILKELCQSIEIYYNKKFDPWSTERKKDVTGLNSFIFMPAGDESSYYLRVSLRVKFKDAEKYYLIKNKPLESKFWCEPN